MAGFLDWVLHWLTQYGDFGLFGLLILGIVGLPVPDETLLVFSGYLISRGHLHPVWTFVAGFLGSACGISLSYTIGRTLGCRAVVRYGRRFGLTEERMDRAHGWFAKTGEWLLAFGYFIPGVRHFTALVAGTSKLEFRTFAMFAWSGAAGWVATFLTFGYFVGENWKQALRFVDHYTYVSVAIGVVIGLGYWWLHRKLAK